MPSKGPFEWAFYAPGGYFRCRHCLGPWSYGNVHDLDNGHWVGAPFPRLKELHNDYCEVLFLEALKNAQD